MMEKSILLSISMCGLVATSSGRNYNFSMRHLALEFTTLFIFLNFAPFSNFQI